MSLSLVDMIVNQVEGRITLYKVLAIMDIIQRPCEFFKSMELRKSVLGMDGSISCQSMLIAYVLIDKSAEWWFFLNLQILLYKFIQKCNKCHFQLKIGTFLIWELYWKFWKKQNPLNKTQIPLIMLVQKMPKNMSQRKTLNIPVSA